MKTKQIEEIIKRYTGYANNDANGNPDEYLFMLKLLYKELNERKKPKPKENMFDKVGDETLKLMKDTLITIQLNAIAKDVDQIKRFVIKPDICSDYV